MFCLLFRKNDTVKVQLKRDQYVIVQLSIKGVKSNYAVKKDKLYELKGNDWEKISCDDPYVDLVTILVEKGWTVWKYQQEMLEKLIYDWHHGDKAEWLFHNERFDIKRIELHHKNVLIVYDDGEIKNFSFPNQDLKSFPDYNQIKDKPLIKIQDGLRIPVRDV